MDSPCGGQRNDSSTAHRHPVAENNCDDIVEQFVEYLLKSSRRQVPITLAPLKQVIIFLWCSAALEDERRQFMLEVVPELQHTCQCFGAELAIIDYCDLQGSIGVTLQLDLLGLYMVELDHCKHLSNGPFLTAIIQDDDDPILLPPVLIGEAVQAVKETLQGSGEDCNILEQLYKPALSKQDGGRLFQLKAHDQIGQDAYSTICSCVDRWRRVSSGDTFALSKVFPRFYELLLAVAADGRKNLAHRCLVVLKKSPGAFVKVIRDHSSASFALAAWPVASALLNQKSSADKSSPQAAAQSTDSKLFSRVDLEVIRETPLSRRQSSADYVLKYSGVGSSYLNKFCRRVSVKLKQKIQAAMEGARELKECQGKIENAFKTDSLVHDHYGLDCRRQPMLCRQALLEQTKKLFQSALGGSRRSQLIMIRGDQGQGKTHFLAHVAEAVRSWTTDAYVMLRFARLTPLSSSVQELLFGCCLHLCRELGVDPRLPQRASLYNCQQLFEWFQECCSLVASRHPGKPVVLLIDDVHKLKEISSIADYQFAHWIPPCVPDNAIFLLTACDDISTEEALFNGHVPLPGDCVISIPPLGADECCQISRAYGSLQFVEKALEKVAPCPLAVRLVTENPNLLSSDVDKLSCLVESSLEHAERVCGQQVCRHALSMIECAHFGLTVGELLDLMTCSETVMRHLLQLKVEDVELYQFPVSLWLRMKNCLGSLLKEVVCDDRTVYKWAHNCAITIVRRRYLHTIQDLKTCHAHLAALFSGTLSNANMEDENGSRIHLRPVMPRPLMCINGESGPLFNLRTIRNLWYHLLHTGSVDNLQAQSLCNFEYLYAAVKSVGIFHLKIIFENAMLQLLNHNFHVLYSSVLRPSASILCQDGDLLAAEVIIALHYTRKDNTDVLNDLLEQAMSWVDSCYSIPLLVPLASWVKPMMCPLVVSMRFCDLPTSLPFDCILEPTLNHQHVLIAGVQTNHKICMYHMPSRKMVRTFEGHVSPVVYLKTIADGQLFLSCSSDGTVMIWSWTHVHCQCSFKPAEGKLLSACVAHSENFLLTGFADGKIHLNGLGEGGNHQLRTFVHHAAPVTSMALTSQDLYLLSGSADFTVSICCMSSGNVISKLSGLMAPVRSLAVTSNDAFAIVSCEDESLKVFSVCMSVYLLELLGHEGKVCSLSIAKDDCHVFAGSSDGRLYCFDLHTGVLVSTQTCHQRPVTCLKMSADGMFLISGSSDAFNVWSTYTHTVDHPIDDSNVSSLAMSPDNKYAAYGSSSGKVILWDLDECRGIWMTPGEDRPAVTSLCFDPDSLVLLTGSADGMVCILSMSNGATLKTFEGHINSIIRLHIFSDRSVVISLDSAGQIILWSTEDTEDCSYDAFCLTNIGSTLEFLEDRDLLISTRKNEKELKVLNMIGREEAWQTKARLLHSDAITCVATSADHQVIVTGSKDLSLKVWNVKTSTLTQVMAEHKQPPIYCAVCFDGSIVASASENELFTWNVYNGQRFCSFTSHRESITCMALSFDGKIVLSGDKGGWLYAWNTVTAAVIASFNAHLPILEMIISPDCRRVLLKLQRCKHVACLCLHNIPSLDDYERETRQQNVEPCETSSITMPSPREHNESSAQSSPRVAPSFGGSFDGTSKRASLKTPRSASSTFPRNRTSLRLLDKLLHNQKPLINAHAKTTYRGEMIPATVVASQNVLGAIVASQTCSAVDRAFGRQTHRSTGKTKVCAIL